MPTKTTKLADVYVVTSGKGGVGKTTTTASIGAALAIKGKRTLVVDADIGLRNLDVILGLESRVVFNIVDVAKLYHLVLKFFYLMLHHHNL